MTETVKYELTKIIDIFNQVPVDEIEQCCREIGIGLKQARLVYDLAVEVEPTVAKGLVLDEAFVWSNDGKGEMRTDVIVTETGETLGSVITTTK